MNLRFPIESSWSGDMVAKDCEVVLLITRGKK